MTMGPEGTAGTILVVGACPDWALAVDEALKADRVLFLTLEGAERLTKTLGYRGTVIGFTADFAEAESLAWAWAEDLNDYLGTSQPWLSPEVLHATRRMLYQQILLPIAVARIRARAIDAALPRNARLRMCGVTEIEAREIAAAVPGSAYVTTPPPEPMLRPQGYRRVHAWTRRQLLRARYVLLLIPISAARRRRELERLRRRLASHDNSAPQAMRALVLFGAKVHLRLLRSTVRELESRGWSVLLGNWNAEMDCVAPAAELGADLIDLEPLAEATTPARQSLIAQRQCARLREPIIAWARLAGLETHAHYMADGFNERYELVRRWMRAHRELVHTHEPHVIITVNEISDIVEAMVPVSKGAGIPTVDVQHGSALINHLNRDFRFDAFCVWGEADKATFESLGTAPETIRVTGNPFLTPSTVPAERACSAPAAELDDGTFRILFAASYTSGNVGDMDLYETLDRVLRYADQDPTCRIVVKLHPVGNDKEFGYEVALREHPTASVEVTRDKDLYELIRECDCVATHASTVAIEAVAFRKPTIITSLGDSRDPLTMVAEGVALHAADVQQFGECVMRIRAGNAIPEDAFAHFESCHSFGQDGLAGSRIADVCEELASKSAAARAW